jgi:4-amino-4-deoxy-L-arabinose transferase-like glycosyltransferase
MLVLVSSVVTYSFFRPSERNVAVEEGRGQWHAIDIPYMAFNPQRLQSHIRFVLQIPHPSSQTTFVLTARDHIDSFSVMAITGARLPLGQYLHAGDNAVDVVLSVTTNPPVMIFAMEPSLWHWQSLLLFAFCVFALCAWVFFLRSFGILSFPRSALFITFFGIVLRTVYTFSTPSFLRSYDAQGHLDYIRFLLDHVRLPLAGEIWQGHQAPLFYLLSAPFAWLAQELHVDASMTSMLLQILPLVLSICTLLVGVSIILRSFSSASSRVIGTLVIAVFPALVYQSAQISNDVLLTLFGFLWYGSVLRALTKNSALSWIAVGLLCGLGLLTKANSASWMIISIVLIALSAVPVRRRAEFMLMMIASTFATGGWWYVWGFFSTQHYSLVANAFQQISTVLLTPTVREIFTFNPIAILLHPSASASDPLTRSAFFLETLFRTSQVGSLHFSNTEMMLSLALILLLPMLYGAVRECKDRLCTHTITIILFVLSILLFRLQYPFSVSQHFRYITPMVLPIVCLLLRGIAEMRPLFLRILAEATVGVYALMVMILMLSVAYFA